MIKRLFYWNNFILYQVLTQKKNQNKIRFAKFLGDEVNILGTRVHVLSKPPCVRLH